MKKSLWKHRVSLNLVLTNWSFLVRQSLNQQQNLIYSITVISVTWCYPHNHFCSSFFSVPLYFSSFNWSTHEFFLNSFFLVLTYSKILPFLNLTIFLTVRFSILTIAIDSCSPFHSGPCFSKFFRIFLNWIENYKNNNLSRTFPCWICPPKIRSF